MEQIEEQEFERPSNKGKSRAGIVSAITAAVLACIGLALFVSYSIFQPIVIQKPVVVNVAKGETPKELSKRLKQHGLIRSTALFQLLYALRFSQSTIKEGEYTFSEPYALFDMALAFIRGAPKKEREITIIEGWTIGDIASYLEDTGVLSADDFANAAARDYSTRFPFVPAKPGPRSLEGYLFPDTYRIFEKSGAEDIITKMLENFQEKYSAQMIEETLKRKRDIHGIATLASILEKEVAGARDRRLVADIFYRRLAAGMPLQADSTINYVTGKKTPSVSASDLEISSPYNTYKLNGLPPGPIGNPGLSALQAALSPIDNPFWFFLTTPAGDVVYSKTFEEHVKNKLKYLK